jgi:hypothetical protein
MVHDGFSLHGSFQDNDEEEELVRGANLKLAQRHKKITAGEFKGKKKWEPEETSPGVVGTVAMSFMTSVNLPKESRITFQLPDHGWILPHKPNIVMRLPQGIPTPILQSVWHQSSRLLDVKILDENVPADTSIVLILSGAMTPECATPEGEVVVTSFEKLVVRNTVPPSTRGGQILDGPTKFIIPKILPGQIIGLRKWIPFNCCPGIVSDVSLSFVVNGTIPSGGKILLELPGDGWDMDDKPSVELRSHEVDELPAAWNRAQNVLEITLANVSVKTKTPVVLVVSKVKNPPKEIPHVKTARLTTLTSSGGVIDGPCKIDVSRISELRDIDFEIARTSFDEEDVEKTGVIELNKTPKILQKAGIKLSERLYNTMVLEPLSSHQQQLPDDLRQTSSTVPISPAEEKRYIKKEEFLNLFATIYAPAYKYGQELRIACGRGETEKIEEFLCRGCDPNAKDGSGWSALHYAADFNRLEAINTLVTFCGNSLQINIADVAGWTPLMNAAANAHVAVVEKLIALGADLSLPNAEGRTALHWAASRGMDEVVKVLLAAGGNKDAKDKNGWTPLHCAILHGCVSTAQLLAQNGASATATDKLKHPPLYFADPIDVEDLHASFSHQKLKS